MSAQPQRMKDINDYFDEYWSDIAKKVFPAPKKPTPWLDTAKEITSSDRQRDYGRPLKNFLRWALVDNIQDAGRRNPGDYITPLDEAHGAINLKQVRDWNGFKADNWIDTMGYSATVNDMDNQMKELGYENGVKTFQTMRIGDMFELLDYLIRNEADHGKGTARFTVNFSGENDPYIASEIARLRHGLTKPNK